jgi:hypothetical protein
MSPPVRMRDDASAPGDGRALLRSARGSQPMPPEARARSAARIDRLLVVPAAAGVLFWIKGVAAAGICFAGVVAAVHVAPALLARIESEPPSRAPIASPRAATPSTEAARGNAPLPSPSSVDRSEPALPETAPSPLPASSIAPTAHSRDRRLPAEPSSSADAVDPLAREAAMLEAARGALDRDPARTLALLDRHAATFPSGGLAIERELLAVDALERLGRFREAQARGTALLERAPGSIYEERVKALLERGEKPRDP